MKSANIYIDEFGNSHLDLSKNGTFSHFIYTSVIIDTDDIEKAHELRNSLCQKYKLGTDIKSSNLGEKYFQKRLNILNELTAYLNFTIDVFVVDKSKIYSQGLKNKRVFYKYFQSLFINKYNKRFESFSIYADKVGTDFTIDLKSYIQRKSIQRDLFHPNRFFEISDDKSEKLIQLADFISGCTGKIFCTSHAHERAKDIYNIIHARTSVEHFTYDNNSFNNNPSPKDFDFEIQKMTKEVIIKYFENSQSAVGREKARLLEYLSLYNRINPNRFIPTHELVFYMNNFYPNITSDKIRTLVRDLRYEGLFIVSHSGKSGYKLANSYNDIHQHFNHFLKYIIPMLQKIQILNSTISSSSLNKINPIEKDQNLIQLKNLISGLR